MKKIMLTIGKLDMGGAEMRLLNLINDLNDLNVNAYFYIYVNSGEKGVLTEDFLKNKNLNIIYGVKGFKGLGLFYRTLKKINPDILHLNSSLAAGIYALIGKMANIKNIYSHIRTAEHYGNGFLYHSKQFVFSTMMNIFSDKVIGVCDGARKLSKTNLKKWKTIYNGIHIKENLPINNYKKFSLICIGRQNIAKNQPFLIDVLKELKEHYPDRDWKLDYYGREDANIMKEIKEKIDSYGLHKDVSLCGETKDPLNTISNYHLLLLPSIREGLPGVVLEALSVGRKAIVSNLDGCQEIAHIIPHVKVVEKFSPDLWAEIIYENCEENDNQANLIVKDFRKSIFIHDNHVKAMLNLWEV